MNQDAIKTIGKKQTPREISILYLVNEVEGLVNTLDKNFSEWSDFDRWENLEAQKWIFSRALDLHRGKKIDIQCECCEVIDLTQIEI